MQTNRPSPNRQGQTASNRFSSSVDYVESAREKLRLLGLQEAQIEEIETQSKPTDHLTIYAPVSGTVAEINEALRDKPESVNEDPLGGGWYCSLTLSDSAELEGLRAELASRPNEAGSEDGWKAELRPTPREPAVARVQGLMSFGAD